jgi:tRNA(Ile)-lysidine synthase
MTAGSAHDAPAVPDAAPPDVPLAALPGLLPRGSDRSALLAEVHARLARVPVGADVLVACSGGPDSTALALLVRSARPDLHCTLVYVAHGLRAPEQDAQEAALVAALAVRIGAEHVVRTVRVVRAGGGLEADARDVRHAELDALADERGAAVILYGHHADDQAETLLLRLARGTGLDGVTGMAHVAGRRVRPLLSIRRDDLRRILEGAHGLRTADDPMNVDAELRRVRVRRDVLPALGTVGPDVVGALSRLATLAGDDAELLEQLATDAVAQMRHVRLGDVVAVDAGELAGLHVALLRRVLRRLLAEVAGAGPDASSVERLVRAVRSSPSPWRATLPGPIDAAIERGVLVLVPAVDVSAPSPGTPQPPVSVLEVPGRVVWDAAGLLLTAGPAAARAEAAEAAEPSGPAGVDPLGVLAQLGALVGLDTSRLRVELAVPGPFVVRARRDGDRLRTHGGSRTLADVMGEAGVLRALRHRLPVVADAPTDRPLWVPGLVVDVEAAALPDGPLARCVLTAAMCSEARPASRTPDAPDAADADSALPRSGQPGPHH